MAVSWVGGGDCGRASEVMIDERETRRKRKKEKRLSLFLESSSFATNVRRLKTRAMAGSAPSSQRGASETPPDATGERVEPQAVATDSLPATATTQPRSAPPRELPRDGGAFPSRVFLAPVEDAPHSEHALSFLLDHVAREGDVVHLLVVVPATHPSSALAYGGPMVPRVARLGSLSFVSSFTRASERPDAFKKRSSFTRPRELTAFAVQRIHNLPPPVPRHAAVAPAGDVHARAGVLRGN